MNLRSSYDLRLGYSLWSFILWDLSTFCYSILFQTEKPSSKDDLLQMVCPDSDADDGEMLSTEKTIQFYVQHVEVTCVF